MSLPDPRPVLLVAAAVAAMPLASCGASIEPRRPAARTPSPVSIGRPIAPRRVTVPGPGTVELRALSPTGNGRPTWLAIVLSTPGADPRDVCVATGLAQRSLGEANTYCAVRAPAAATFVARDGIPDRYGPGAVFDDEIGESIVALSYDEVVRRFGAPAAVRTEEGRRCAFYEVVGRARRGWRFCFAADGRMLGAGGNTRLP
jgi:hypothetical protein